MVLCPKYACPESSASRRDRMAGWFTHPSYHWQKQYDGRTMDWITLSLLAPALLTGVMFVDKYVLTDRVKDVRGVPLYQSAVAILIVLILCVAHPWTQASRLDAVLILVAGIVGTFGAVLYFFALAESHTGSCF